MLDSGARGATTTFVQRGIGDVLLAWENEAYLALEEGKDKVRDRRAVAQHPGRAAGGGRRQGRRQEGHAGRSPRPTCSSSTRPKGRRSPRSTTTGRAIESGWRSTPATFAKVKLFTIDEAFGGWQTAQKTHFADGGTLRPDLPAGRSPVDGSQSTADAPHACCPGFRLTLGFTLFYLSLIVLVPLLTLPARTATMTWDAFWQTITDPRVVASYRLSIGASLVAAARQRGVRPDRRLGARALLVSRAAHRRLAGRSAVRAADGGRRHHADDDLRAERLARPAARAVRHQGRVHARSA